MPERVPGELTLYGSLEDRNGHLITEERALEVAFAKGTVAGEVMGDSMGPHSTRQQTLPNGKKEASFHLSQTLDESLTDQAYTLQPCQTVLR